MVLGLVALANARVMGMPFSYAISVSMTCRGRDMKSMMGQIVDGWLMIGM
jgi:hypothetical protein